MCNTRIADLEAERFRLREDAARWQAKYEDALFQGDVLSDDLTRLRGMEAQAMSDRPCEGACEVHSSPVVRVDVSTVRHYWGCFWYCPAAIVEDKRRGFTVKEVVMSKGGAGHAGMGGADD